MCQFLETIQLNNGVFGRLDLHQSRMKNAVMLNYPTRDFNIDLKAELIKTNYPKNGLYKCRVIYDTEIRAVEFHSYTTPTIQSLKIVETKIHSLSYKLTDRADYQAAFAQRAGCDDVLLVKNGLLTDTSYCNIALFDGQNWYTPTTPLIYGVNRAQLLSEGTIIERDIALIDMHLYSTISLFNALNEHKTLLIPISELCL